MTNEEAIQYIIRHCNPDYPKGKTEWETAINMAINALKAQLSSCSEIPNSSDDLISRQAAINYVDDIPYIKEHPNLGLIWKEWIEALPSAEPEPQWIPVSERLPENDKRVLATTAWGDVTIAERIYPPINDTCWFIQDGNTNATIDDVVAWMQLPEPYKE